jgi:predicted lipoprotein with Yx(FWY)xxD motif
MPTDNRSGAVRAAAPRLGLIATAAAFATLAALVFLLLRPASSDAAQTSGQVVSTAKTSLGRILVNSRGRTLYLFAKDTNGKSHCTGMCATFWPPLITSGKPRAGTESVLRELQSLRLSQMASRAAQARRLVGGFGEIESVPPGRHSAKPS